MVDVLYVPLPCDDTGTYTTSTDRDPVEARGVGGIWPGHDWSNALFCVEDTAQGRAPTGCAPVIDSRSRGAAWGGFVVFAPPRGVRRRRRRRRRRRLSRIHLASCVVCLGCVVCVGVVGCTFALFGASKSSIDGRGGRARADSRWGDVAR